MEENDKAGDRKLLTKLKLEDKNESAMQISREGMFLAEETINTEALHQRWAWDGPRAERRPWAQGQREGREMGKDKGAEVSMGKSVLTLIDPGKVFGF